MKNFYLTCCLLFSINCHANTIISIERGLTLAQVSVNDQTHTIAVIADKGDLVEGIDISALSGTPGDMLSVYKALGYDRIVQLLQLAPQTAFNNYLFSVLESPAGTKSHHIALGFNYAEHADEINEKHLPFLFLRTLTATREQAIGYSPNRLLDYEVEICARPISDITQYSDFENTAFGFFLCGDFTDRAYLMRNMDMDNMRSGKGFNGAKSVPGYFPTGPYMVIPKNRREFIKDIDFSLARNGEIKQHANAGEMIWPLDTILRQAFNAHTHRTPTFAESSRQWLPENMLSADTVIVTGTPQGVIMKPPGLSFKILHGSKYIFSGAVFSMKATDYIIEEYIKFLTKEEIFLKPGENILMRAKFLGSVRVKIE
ncbi:MAG: fumarylacetoacetate hydrolase family protein [Pseudomonadota bacterium]